MSPMERRKTKRKTLNMFPSRERSNRKTVYEYHGVIKGEGDEEPRARNTKADHSKELRAKFQKMVKKFP